MGRSDVRAGWWGRRRRGTRTAAGAQLVDRPSVTFPRLLLGRVRIPVASYPPPMIKVS